MNVFLVTNADTPAGFRIATDLLRSGHRVVLTGTNATALVRITHGHSSDRVLAVVADISDLAQVRRLIDHSERHFGAIDFVVAPDGVARRCQESTILRLGAHPLLAAAS